MKIIRNIDGKKLELTLTNEEAMSVFMDVFFDTDRFADYPANGLFGRGDGIFAGWCKQDISSVLDCEGTRKPSDLVLQYLGKQMQDTLNCEYEHLSDDIAERYTNILHWAERHSICIGQSGTARRTCKQHLKKQSGGITARRTPSHMAVIRCKRMTAMTSCSRWCWKTFCSITRKSSEASRRMRNKPAFMTSLKNRKLRN